MLKLGITTWKWLIPRVASFSLTVCDKTDHPVVFGRSVARANLTRYAVKMDLTPEMVG